MNKLDWKSYEELVKNIYEQLGRVSGVKILGHGSSCKFKGKSGVEHQIDVLTSHNDGIHDYLTDIECKYWNQKIDKDIVMKVKEIVLDCNFSKGVVVSKLGFTPDAITYANYVGIGLVELREITDEDWKNRIRYIIINIVAHYPELLSVHVEAESDEKKDGGKEEMQVVADSSRVEICYPDGKIVTMKDFIIEEFVSKLTEEVKTEKFVFDKGSVLEYKDIAKKFFLRSITLTGRMASLASQSVINGDDYVFYYMKCIFEGYELTIGKNGEIYKH